MFRIDKLFNLRPLKNEESNLEIGFGPMYNRFISLKIKVKIRQTYVIKIEIDLKNNLY